VSAPPEDSGLPAPGPARVAALGLAFMLGALFVERLSQQTFFDPDGFHQMALFRAWLRTGSLQLHDSFAFTPTIYPAVHHEWGAGAILYAIATRLGAPGVMAWRWLVSAAVAIVATTTALRRAPAMVAAFCAPAATLLGQVAFTTIRAGLYTMLFLAILLAAIDRDRDDAQARRFLLIVVPVLALWINLHAGWVVGAGAIGLYAGEQVLRRRPFGHLLIALAAVPVLMVLTPYGRLYVPGWWRSITFRREQIGEWAPLIQSPYVIGLAAFGLAILLLAYAIARRGPRLPGLPFVLAVAWGAWRHERHVALFALAWFCAVPGYLAATPLGALLEAPLARPRAARALALVSGLVGIGLLMVAAPRHPFRLRLPAQASDRGDSPVVYPAGAVDYLAANQFHGKVVTSFLNGGFVIWKLWPAARVSFDGRYEAAYPREALDDDITLHRARAGWAVIVARDAPDAILVERDEPLAAALPAATGLARVYRDDAYEVWARPALNLPVIVRTGQVIPAAFP
jgi:hypothetical protein